LDQLVDLGLVVTGITTLLEVKSLSGETTSWAVELEGPQELVDLSETGTDGVDLVNNILNADGLASQTLLDNRVVGDWSALTIDLGETTLVDELTDRLE
jgi:hypothetical protein